MRPLFYTQRKPSLSLLGGSYFSIRELVRFDLVIGFIKAIVLWLENYNALRPTVGTPWFTVNGELIHFTVLQP